MRVCHVVSTLDVGGIERWLSNVAAQMIKVHGDEIQFDFLTLLGDGGRLSGDLEKMGCGVSAIAFSWKSLGSSFWQLLRFFKQRNYDVIHCHADYLSGVVLLAAKRAGVQLKINHIHNTRFPFEDTSRPLRWFVGRILRRLCLFSADLQIGCSQASLDAFVGHAQKRHPSLVHFCSTPLDSFRNAIEIERHEAKKRLGIDTGRPVIIHVGRHSEQKNLFFMLDVLTALHEKNKNVLALLAGSGPLSQELKEIVAARGLEEQIVFLGDRSDVPMLFRASDQMILPSFYEGLPVAVVEAQAAGVRCLIADNITKEVDVVPGLVERLPLAAGSDKWADHLNVSLAKNGDNRREAFELVAASFFDLGKGCDLLYNLYHGAEGKTSCSETKCTQGCN